MGSGRLVSRTGTIDTGTGLATCFGTSQGHTLCRQRMRWFVCTVLWDILVVSPETRRIDARPRKFLDRRRRRGRMVLCHPIRLVTQSRLALS
eukprot:scaffold8681_cov200-Amphora_coffeaeformis.AAC.14